MVVTITGEVKAFRISQFSPISAHQIQVNPALGRTASFQARQTYD